jgi:hypothetical protein
MYVQGNWNREENMRKKTPKKFLEKLRSKPRHLDCTCWETRAIATQLQAAAAVHLAQKREKNIKNQKYSRPHEVDMYTVQAYI